LGAKMNVDDTMNDNSSQTDVGKMLGGLTFLKTKKREELVDFYTKQLKMQVWLEQPDITILSHGNLLVGLHQQNNEKADLQGMYTFVYPSLSDVDTMYDKLQAVADDPPRCNDKYSIYQFFARDPEGRQLEFQAFLHPVATVTSDPNQRDLPEQSVI